MILYNVSFNMNNLSHVMVPMIPESAAEDENKTIPRICFTDSVEHCMQAIAVGNRDISVGNKFILRTIEVSNRNPKIVTPTKLFNSKYVPDALENKEYWCLKTTKCRLYIYQINDFNYEFDLAWTCIPLSGCVEILSKYANITYTKCKTAKAAWNKFCLYTEKYRLWNEQDNAWDDLAMLPYAQATKIYNLRYTFKEI